MTSSLPVNRRVFCGAAGLSALALTSGLSPQSVAGASSSRDPYRGLKVGLASYSTRKFSLDETLSMMKELQIQYVTLKDFHLKMDSSVEERKAAAQKVKDAGGRLMGAGVVYLKNDEKQVRNAFE
ncbi:MAG: sugar phosphate isomerase/epimerase family protein, partial [Candidatus Hinthialibacter sp.]